MSVKRMGDWLMWAARRLSESGIPGARREAELLLSFVTGLRREEILVREGAMLDPSEAGRFEECVLRRGRREPLAYITGFREFFGMPFRVSPGVLIPRPETELLVETALARLPPANGGIMVADVCTGSGAIAVALAVSRADVRMLACDIAEPAVLLASENARLNGVSERVLVLQGDLLEPLKAGFPKLDAILSNPPYIPAGVIRQLEPEVGVFEPWAALDGGVDGLDFYRRICRDARSLLAPGGFVALEIGHDQGEAVIRIGQENGWRGQCLKDLAGWDRVVVLE